MTQATIADTFEEALDEALAYRRMNGLTDKVLRGIAWDYSVSYDKLKQELENS